MNWVEAINVEGEKPKGRYGHSASVIGSNMYVFGGCTGKGELDMYFIY